MWVPPPQPHRKSGGCFFSGSTAGWDVAVAVYIIEL